MALSVGTRIGQYEIVSAIGSGGMGEVYRARDSKLNRDVALKIVPEAFASDPDRLARFTREAQTLAALSHPNIGHIYGFEDSGATHALVLELIEGPTLAELISLSNTPSSGARPGGHGLPLDEALAIAKQIADALEAAHEQGIVHRDLKPANIKVRPDGIVKVLDFGLAKALDPGSSSGVEAMNSPTLTTPAQMTRNGAILGTAAYMSPEQARGRAVDKRTDIWAFGCVLYETLTGRIAFKGDTVADTVVAVLGGEPEWDALPAATPASVRVLLQRCLEKDWKRRLRDIGDARIEIDQIEGRSSGIAAVPREPASQSTVASQAAPERRQPSAYLAAGLIVLTLLAAVVALFYSRRLSAPVSSPSEYTQITNFTDSATAPSLSPDGRMVTFIRGGEAFLSRGQIYVKLLPNGESVRLTSGADSKLGPVFTPDGSRIAYTSVTPSPTVAWDTWTVPVLGGQPTRLLPNASGLVWLDDQHVMFSEIRGTGLHMGIVTATESRAEQRDIYFPAHERAMAHYSYASPDRRSVLVVEMDRTGTFNQPCGLVPFDGGSAGRRDVGPEGACTSAAWSPDGKWMYFRVRVGSSSHLWRQKFPDGRPEQITFGPTEEEGLAVAPDGRSLITSIGTRRSAIWIHDATGERAISSEGYAVAPRLSSDGTRLFYLLQPDSTASSAELRSMDLASGKTDSLLPGLSVTDYDISKDEKEVAFTTRSGSGESQIWLASLDRRTPPRQIARAADEVSFGADGELVFRSLEEHANLLVRIKTDGSQRERISTALVMNKYGVSPDGEWALVFSAGTGTDLTPETIAIPVHGGAPRRVGPPNAPGEWSANGRLFYLTVQGQTLAIPVPPGKSLPELPVSGIHSVAAGRELPGVQVIEHDRVSPGPDRSTYLFVKTDLQRNLFRIQLR